MVSHIGNIISQFSKPNRDSVVKVIKKHTAYEIKKTSYQIKKGVLVLKNISPLLKTKILVLKTKIIHDLQKEDINISDIM
jgi:hypothetical protein